MNLDSISKIFLLKNLRELTYLPTIGDRAHSASVSARGETFNKSANMALASRTVTQDGRLL